MKYTLIIIAALTVAVAGYARQVPELAGNVRVINPPQAVREAAAAGHVDAAYGHRIAMLPPITTGPNAVMYTGLVVANGEGDELTEADRHFIGRIEALIAEANAEQIAENELVNEAESLMVQLAKAIDAHREQRSAFRTRLQGLVTAMRTKVNELEAELNTPAQPN